MVDFYRPGQVNGINSVNTIEITETNQTSTVEHLLKDTLNKGHNACMPLTPAVEMSMFFHLP